MTLRKIAEVPGRIRDLRTAQIKINKDRGKSDIERKSAHDAISLDIVRKLKAALDDAVYWSQLDGDLVKYGKDLPPNIQVIEQPMPDSSSSNEQLHDRIREDMRRLSNRWGAFIEQMNLEEPPRAPVLYGLVIIAHLVYIVTMDGSDPQASVHVPILMNMTERNQQQWNALAVMVTVCWARDQMMALAAEMMLDGRLEKVTDSDPDA